MGTSHAPVEILERARRAGALDAAEIGALTRYWVDGIATDIQMAAWCSSPAAMSAGADVADEICRALVASGRRLRPASLGPTADKHTSGGVGDTTSLIAVPLARALGAHVLKLSGSEHEHFGGTLTKLAAIPGMSTELPPRELLRAARDGGAVIAGGPLGPAPAAARLESLLAAVGGVGSPALVGAQIAARAISTGAAGVVIQVTHGRGGTFADRGAATRCAEIVGELLAATGRQARCGVSEMTTPLGPAVGTALEVAGAARILRGEGDGPLADMSCALAGEMAEAAGVIAEGEGVVAATAALGDGSGLEAAERWIEGQGGDSAIWTDRSRLARAPLDLPVPAPRSGIMAGVDPRAVGVAARLLGAGRLHASQGIDYGVGVSLRVAPGESVAAGDELATVHARDAGLGERAVEMVAGGVELADAASGASSPIEWAAVARA